MIYLDSAATTAPSEKCAAAVSRAMSEYWGNPSSLHAAGLAAQELLERSRSIVADSLGAAPEEVFFAPSGTAAANTAIFGALRKNRGVAVVTSSIEHPCTVEPVARLEREGARVVRLRYAEHGFDLSEFEDAVDADTALVTVMYVNNELGTILPVEKLRGILDRKNSRALLHIDAVQAFGKLPFCAPKLGADLLSVSAHKVHGPRGVGALYVRKGLRIPALLLGGGQENGMFSGTENLPAAAGFAAAVSGFGDLRAKLGRAAELKKRLVSDLSAIEGLVINSPPDALPYIVSLSVPGIPSEVMVNALSEKGICVSAGSACHRGRRSDVLTAAGLPPELIDSALRVSTDADTTEKELDVFAAELEAIVARVRRRGK
ncbi:MAG: cysteine desulfurase [Clostridia bacterium]|nr:cysteine desulfurase [Clostridia bacterium]